MKKSAARQVRRYLIEHRFLPRFLRVQSRNVRGSELIIAHYENVTISAIFSGIDITGPVIRRGFYRKMFEDFNSSLPHFRGGRG